MLVLNRWFYCNQGRVEWNFNFMKLHHVELLSFTTAVPFFRTQRVRCCRKLFQTLLWCSRRPCLFGIFSAPIGPDTLWCRKRISSDRLDPGKGCSIRWKRYRFSFPRHSTSSKSIQAQAVCWANGGNIHGQHRLRLCTGTHCRCRWQ